MRLSGYINSNNGWEHVLEKGTDLLESGCSLIIWPEGHRSRDGKLRRFKNGAFQLSLSTGRPIVPVCVIGSRQMLPPGSRLLNPARVRLILLPAVYPSGSSNNADDIKNMKDKVRNDLAEELIRNNMLASGKTFKANCSCSTIHSNEQTTGSEAAL